MAMKTERPAETEPTTPRPAKRARVGKKSKSFDANAQENSSAKVPKFLRSLYAILQTEDPQVIAWVQNEQLKPNSVTAFHILQMQRFEREILPKYFKHQKFASFQRQLNNFGFRKWTKTQSSGVCTFSHNCFPPDLTCPPSPNMSVRDQWRQKSTQVIPPPASATDAVRRPRVVGNGNKIKQERTAKAARRCPINVQVPARDILDTAQFAEMYRSPHSASMESNAYRLNSSHQPPLKKLARPSVGLTQDSMNGLEAFNDESFKQFILPPLQPHHLLAATPRSSITPSFSSPNDSNPPAFGGFRYSLAQPLHHGSNSSDLAFNGNNFKSFDCKPQPEPQPHAYAPVTSSNSNNGAADAALQGILEPWMWDAQTSPPGFESFPLEFDWQDGAASGPSNTAVPATSVSVSVGTPPVKDECHQDRGLPSNAEEFGLDSLLFVE